MTGDAFKIPTEEEFASARAALSNTAADAVDLTEEALLNALKDIKDFPALRSRANALPVPVPPWLYNRLMADDPEAWRIYEAGVARYRFES